MAQIVLKSRGEIKRISQKEFYRKICEEIECLFISRIFFSLSDLKERLREKNVLFDYTEFSELLNKLANNRAIRIEFTGQIKVQNMDKIEAITGPD